MFSRRTTWRSVAATGVVAVVATLVGGVHSAQAITVPICFPVTDQPVTFTNSFGDPRGGGRIHEGEDLMGQKMFRLVAPVDGVILAGTTGVRWSGTGHSDHSLRMRGDDGYYYAFLHMNDDTPGTDDGQASYDEAFGPGIAPGVRVRAGQLLGFMGDSGNAEATSPHLHFEMRRPSSTDPNNVWASTAFDPYDSLQAARRCDGSDIEQLIPGDFDGDGFGELFGYVPGAGADTIYEGTANRTLVGDATRNVHGSYQPLAGDFDGDGRTDILWYGPGTAAESIWYGTDSHGQFTVSSSPPVNGTYIPLLGDFDGDGYGDILWYAPGPADDYVWYGSGTTGRFDSRPTTTNGSYRPFSGDFDGDGITDIMWYGPGTSPDYAWYGTRNRGQFSSYDRVANGVYQPVAGDFDGDDVDDIFWYASGAPSDYIWYGARSRGSYTSINRNVNGTYQPVAVDLDGDSFDDIFWWKRGTAATPTWFGSARRGVFADVRTQL